MEECDDGHGEVESTAYVVPLLDVWLLNTKSKMSKWNYFIRFRDCYKYQGITIVLLPPGQR